MKGFEITYNGEKTVVVTKSGLLTINIYDAKGNGRIHVENVEYNTQEQSVWYDNSPIKLGDKFHIKMIELENMDNVSEPIIHKIDKDIRCPKSKLDSFILLETHLKERGLL